MLHNTTHVQFLSWLYCADLIALNGISQGMDCAHKLLTASHAHNEPKSYRNGTWTENVAPHFLLLQASKCPRWIKWSDASVSERSQSPPPLSPPSPHQPAAAACSLIETQPHAGVQVDGSSILWVILHHCRNRGCVPTCPAASLGLVMEPTAKQNPPLTLYGNIWLTRCHNHFYILWLSSVSGVQWSLTTSHFQVLRLQWYVFFFQNYF